MATIVIVFTGCHKSVPGPAITKIVEPLDTTACIYGACRKYMEYTYNPVTGSGYLSGSYCAAYFSNDSVALGRDNRPLTYLKMGSVMLNGDNIEYTTPTYYKTLSQNNLSKPATWVVTADADGQMPGFEFTCRRVLPQYAGYPILPTSISKKEGASLVITNYSHVNRIKVFIRSNNTVTGGKQAFAGDKAATVISLLPKEISHLNQNKNATLEVYFFNEEIRTIHGKKIRFSNVLLQKISGFAVGE